MARHISRKELKSNALADGLTHGAEAVKAHKGLTEIIAAAVLVILIAGFGWRYYSQRQTAAATVAFNDAMKVYSARIRPVGEPEVAGETTYVDEKNKFTDAAKHFSEVAAKFSRTSQGKLALYYSGLSLAQIDKNDEAEKELKAVEASGDATLAPLARFQLAQLYDKTNRADQALNIYRELADKPSEFVPRALVLLKMADHHSKTNPEEATKLYNQVKSEFPDTAAAQAADQGLQLLPPAKT